MAHFADYTARMRRILCAEAGKQGGSVKIFSKKARQNRYSKERSPIPFSHLPNTPQNRGLCANRPILTYPHLSCLILSDSSRSGQIGLNQSVSDWFIQDTCVSFATEARQEEGRHEKEKG
jgi:hypothetical protein